MIGKLFDLTLRNDTEGMFGGISSEEMERIDVDATIAEYERQVSAVLARKLPECNVIHQFGPYGGAAVRFHHLTDDHDIVEPYDEVEYYIGQVYDLGTFWVSLEETRAREAAARAEHARVAGSATSPAKAASSASNGKLGGRPKTTA